MADSAELEITGNGVTIANNDTSPAGADHTDFGSIGTASGTEVRSFVILNTGATSLSLGAVTVTGAHASDFGVTQQPGSSVAAGGSTIFQITFDPSVEGLRTATISFTSNDADESPFTFMVQGRGVTLPQDWRQTHFGSSANTGTAADTYDADNDGLANLVEYAFGLSPLNGGSNALPQPQRAGDNFTVSFTEPAGVSGVVYSASYSLTLAPGSWTPIADTGSGTTHVFTVPAGLETKAFVRLEVTAP